MKKRTPGMDMAEERISEVLTELCVFDEEERKKYTGKIMAAVMVGILMDTFMGKGEE